jgi:hypothetical protein
MRQCLWLTDSYVDEAEVTVVASVQLRVVNEVAARL